MIWGWRQLPKSKEGKNIESINYGWDFYSIQLLCIEFQYVVKIVFKPWRQSNFMHIEYVLQPEIVGVIYMYRKYWVY